MSQTLFSATLTFALLAGGTVAIGSEMFGSKPAPAAAQVVATASLPTVTVIGRRPAPVAVALENNASASQRLQ